MWLSTAEHKARANVAHYTTTNPGTAVKMHRGHTSARVLRDGWSTLCLAGSTVSEAVAQGYEKRARQSGPSSLWAKMSAR